MKKLILALIGVVLMANMAYAWQFNAFGYNLAYNEPKEVQTPKMVENVPQIQNKAAPSLFLDEIAIANSYAQAQLTLKELDYRRIGVLDTETMKKYTVYINEDGTVNKVMLGYDNPEAYVEAPFNTVRAMVNDGNVMGIQRVVKMPFSMKVKIFFSRW